MARATAHIVSKQDAERRFPHKVDMRMPLAELDVKVGRMVAWCWQRAEPEAWEQHSHDRRRDDREPTQDVVRFYFMNAQVAEAFRARWL